MDWYAVFTEQAGLLRTALGAADPGARVPTCPGWTFAHLTVHTGRFLGTVSRYLTTGSPVELPPVREQPADPLAYLDARLAEATAALADCPPNRPMWTFSPAAPDLAWVWQRRAAHEVNLRRWDAQAALRTLDRTDQAQAVDAIDEQLTTLLAARLRLDSPPRTAGTAVVRCTDTPRAWLVRLAPGEVPDVRPATADSPDAELANRAENLLYQLRGRMRPTGTGDAEVLAALRMD